MILYYILVPLAWLVFHIGFRVRCEGRENLKKIGTKGCIIAPNHISAIDPVFVVIARFWGQRMTVFAKKELFEINAFLSWFFRCAGAVCVRGTKEEVSVIDDTVKKCQEGGTLLLFPEGTREQEGKFLPLKSGLFVIAAAANVDVVPCRIYYDTPDGKMKLFCNLGKKRCKNWIRLRSMIQMESRSGMRRHVSDRRTVITSLMHRQEILQKSKFQTADGISDIWENKDMHLIW